MKTKKGVFSLFEIAFVLVLLGGITLYGFNELNYDTNPSNKFQAQSFLHTFNFSSQQRTTIIEENLSSNSVEQDWSSIKENISTHFNNYGLYVGNLTIQKQIVECVDSHTYRDSSQKIFLSNESVYTLRTLRLEVCY